MYNELEITKSNNVVKIEFKKERKERKEKLYINDREKYTIKEELTSLHKSIKNYKGYFGIFKRFEEIDFCDLDVDTYSIPFYKISKKKGRVVSDHDISGYIPKGWDEVLTITAVDIEDTRIINKILKSVAFNLTNSDKREIKKIIKESGIFYKNIDDEKE
jgi:hypothetical protein